jgi:hypothetical protein
MVHRCRFSVGVARIQASLAGLAGRVGVAGQVRLTGVREKGTGCAGEGDGVCGEN